MITQDISQVIAAAIQNAQQAGDLPAFEIPAVVVERPKDPTHGDYATPVALNLARPAYMAPAQIAQRIVTHLVGF